MSRIHDQAGVAGGVSADDLARRLSALAEDGGAKGPAPVHLWNPEYCGELDIRIVEPAELESLLGEPGRATGGKR